MGAGMRRVCFALVMGVCIGLTPSLYNYITPKDNITYAAHRDYPSEREVAAIYSHNHMMSVSQVHLMNKSTLNETHNTSSPRKILLDCGGNVASTVQLFRETYPNGRDYIIYSFEIDDRLAPYFEPYENLHLHCPVGVAGKDGNMTAYSESAWSPNKGLNNGRDMQWGGGSLFISNQEKADSKTGGFRKLSYRKVIPTVDLARWIKDTFTIEDYIILKLDVEGAEYEILRNMLKQNAWAYIDKFYGEYHDSQPTGWTKDEKNKLRADIKQVAGFSIVNWVGERRTYDDFEAIHESKVPADTPGTPGNIYSTCSSSGKVSLVVAIGMNLKRAHKVVATLAGYRLRLPITLFLYGDFVEQNPGVVTKWSEDFQIGIREDGHNPPGHLELMPWEWLRMGIVSALLRIHELGITTAYYMPTVQGNLDTKFISTAKTRGLRIVQPAVEFPARTGSNKLTYNNYYRYRDVERVPKALRMIHEELTKHKGGILSLDTDLPDTYMNSVFLIDYLVEKSGFDLVSLRKCIAS